MEKIIIESNQPDLKDFEGKSIIPSIKPFDRKFIIKREDKKVKKLDETLDAAETQPDIE